MYTAEKNRHANNKKNIFNRKGNGILGANLTFIIPSLCKLEVAIGINYPNEEHNSGLMNFSRSCFHTRNLAVPLLFCCKIIIYISYSKKCSPRQITQMKQSKDYINMKFCLLN